MGLFKSDKEREREKAKQRRQATRKAQGLATNLKGRVQTLKRDRDKAWNEAKQYLKNGQKAAAQRSLQTCRSTELLMSKVDRKIWGFEQLLTKLEFAQTDNELAKAIQNVSVLADIDPEAIADAVGDAQDVVAEGEDASAVWDGVYEQEMSGVENQFSDAVPSMDEMARLLEDEVAGSLGEARRSPEGGVLSADKDAELDDQIGEGRSRLRDLLGEE